MELGTASDRMLHITNKTALKQNSISNQVGLNYSEKMMYFSFYFKCAEYWVELGTISKNSVQTLQIKLQITNQLHQLMQSF